MKRVPFTRLQEAVFHIERAYTPLNIQAEATTTARIDGERLATAARRACEAYPVVKGCRRRDDSGPTDYTWVIPDDSADVPVEIVPADDADLGELRRRFYGQRFDLETELPLRLLVVRGGGIDGGDRLCVCASHVSMDGVGALRVLYALLVAYRGDDPTPHPVEESPREMIRTIRPTEPRRRLRSMGAAARRLSYLIDPPERLSSGDSGPVEWRFAHRHVDAGLTGRLIDGGPGEATVNDLLLAALHLTIDRWNASAPDGPDKIGLMMPVNIRPQERFYDGVGLYTLFDSVTTDASHRRNVARAVSRVTEQTRHTKRSDRPLGYLEWWHLASASLPLSVRKRLPRLLDGPGERLLDTAVLSNLGRIPALPTLPDGTFEQLWFTPPCWPPTPVSIGAATVGDRLHLGFRYIRSGFDAAAAESFADRFCERLAATVRDTTRDDRRHL
ncbi:hypothetical protein KY092_17265 [Natronomonas gomsonensis]|uniref:hypothetical protein n=1 Tax=Natronomonas gomsonensis TaxID=1046043 RepID=UPI0020CA6C0A|nr:hypothetical protein [Natronomonas gomsonensis]MCY4732305.1 hypothetical protein [Natronomonas gomsonensis]